MIRFILFFILIFTIFSKNCDAQQNKDLEFYQRKVASYKKMKVTGQVLTAAGPVMMIGGIALIATFISDENSAYGNNNNVHSNGDGGELGTFLAGYALVLLGAGSLGTGIPLWVIGNKKIEKYSKELPKVSLEYKPLNASIGICYSF